MNHLTSSRKVPILRVWTVMPEQAEIRCFHGRGTPGDSLALSLPL